MQRWPAARECLRAERPTPVLAPRKVTVLEWVVDMVAEVGRLIGDNACAVDFTM